ncbi:MAG: tetratricopeptide repeat protein [Chitinophagaceae bacterium]
MKKTIFFLTGILAGTTMMAQSIDDAKQLMYYERFGTATTTLHNVLKNDPANAEAWYWLAESYLQRDENKPIEDSLAAAPADAWNEPIFQVAYGHLLLENNKKDSAHYYFEKALDQTRGRNVAVLAAVARAAIDAPDGDLSYAIEQINKAIKRDKKNASLYILLGNAYRKQNNGTEAYKAYQTALDKDASNAEALYQMGKIFVTQKNSDVYLDYFQKAIAADPSYAPAYYELYNHYVNREPAKAMDYFKKYTSLADYEAHNEYAYTDLLFLNKQYNEAILGAQKLLQQDEKVPRLYKLMAYSYAGIKDTAAAISSMQHYFAQEEDSNLIVWDYDAMAQWYATQTGGEDSAIAYYQKAVQHEKDTTAQTVYYKKLATLSSSLKDYSSAAKWLGNYYKGNPKTTNVDLFNWGVAHFRAEEYPQADSVFGMYVQRYPEQGFGYYWQARSNALIDSTMELGLAVPHYQKLIDVIEKDTTTSETNNTWLIQAFNYLAAYEANIKKDYPAAIIYFNKILAIDPANEQAYKNISILEKNSK